MRKRGNGCTSYPEITYNSIVNIIEHKQKNRQKTKQQPTVTTYNTTHYIYIHIWPQNTRNTNNNKTQHDTNKQSHNTSK